MSEDTQQHILQFLGIVLKKKGAWLWLSILAGVPVAIGSFAALLTYNTEGVHWFDELNYAKRMTPIVVQALIETRDSLNAKGEFHFLPLK